MKTNQQITAIECFHGRVQSSRSTQHNTILAVMSDGLDYTGGELAALTGMTPNIISARLFELREEMKVVERLSHRRICPHSRVSVFVHRKVPTQLELAA